MNAKAVREKQQSYRNHRYVVRNYQSTVDESLFGASRAESAHILRKSWGRLSPLTRSKSHQIIGGHQNLENNGTSHLQKSSSRVDPSGHSIILPPSELSRLKMLATVRSEQEALSHAVSTKVQKERLQQEVELRKQQFADIDKKKQPHASDMDEVQIKDKQSILSAAKEKIEEQDEEIHKLSSMIYEAKCHAIRDAQLLEKVQVKSEALQEELRLDQVMEQTRLEALMQQAEVQRVAAERRILEGKALSEQITQRKEKRLIDDEIKYQEGEAAKLQMARLIEEEHAARLKKKDQQKNTAMALLEANKMMEKRAEYEKQQEKVLDMERMRILRIQAEREEAAEREKEKQMAEKEKEVARLRALQQRAIDQQALKDTIRARRNQEQAEREWRKREKEEAWKRAQLEESLRQAREQQVQDQKRVLSMQAALDKALFENVIRSQREMEERDRQQQLSRQTRQREHAEQVALQVQQREAELTRQRVEQIQEGELLRRDRLARQQRIEAIKSQKLEELRKTGISLKYVQEVARRANVRLSTEIV